jgi:2-phosphoglycolate phosphatase
MCILFDLDGTLLDTGPDFFHAINAVRTAEGLTLLPDSTLPLVRLAVTHGISGLVEAGFGFKNNTEENHAIGIRLLQAYDQILGVYSQPFPGIDRLLHTLDQREIPWGIVTNKDSLRTYPLLDRLTWLDSAATIVCGDTTPLPKPHPAPLLHAAKELDVSPSLCIYVGDAERDIIAGKAAGMSTVAALFGYVEDIHEAKNWAADIYVHHADEILPVYEKWLECVYTL